PPFALFDACAPRMPKGSCVTSHLQSIASHRPRPWRLPRSYRSAYLHFITSSCYQRGPLLNTPRRRTWFLEILEQVRRRYTFVVVGYVVMPEHFHLLISEPERGNPSTVMQVLKQRFARKVLRDWLMRSERDPKARRE